jgi:Fe-S-cluster-containing dehydrogenase component
VRVVRIDEEGIDVPIGCEHCDDPLCILVCPVKAITVDKSTGAVLLDPDKCIGCKQCLVVCPFGAIHYDDTRKLYYKCDLCKGDPECVKWCVTGAIEYRAKLNDVVRTKRVARAERIIEARFVTSK